MTGNHSCEPNAECCFAENYQLELKALRDIAAGEVKREESQKEEENIFCFHANIHVIMLDLFSWQEILISYLDPSDLSSSRNSRHAILRYVRDGF